MKMLFVLALIASSAIAVPAHANALANALADVMLQSSPSSRAISVSIPSASTAVQFRIRLAGPDGNTEPPPTGGGRP